MASNLYYILIVFGTVLFCLGIVTLLKSPFFNLAVSAVKQMNIILDNTLSEEEKDRNILRNLIHLLKFLVLSIVLLIFTVIIGMLPVFIYLQTQNEPVVDVSSIYFYGSMFLGSFSLIFIRTKDDYSYWSKLLHVLILDNYNIGKFLFSKETKNKAQDGRTQDKPFVIISGLARAGTTAIMNLIYSEESFHSINYGNVPFLLSPNLWKKVYKPKSGKQKERAHGDNVLFSENSIEALEEYFFKVFLNDNYIENDRLLKHQISEELLSEYYAYQDLFEQKSGTVYMAKNNNFLLRYESIRKLNKSFKFILVFRKPVDQAKSLMQQHINFVEKQSEDAFVEQYMSWLGHHEFGLNQKYFDFGNEDKWNNYDKFSLSYWVALWINYYAYVVDQIDLNEVILVHYDDLLYKPNELKAALAVSLGKPLSSKKEGKFEHKQKSNDKDFSVEDGLEEQANLLYEKLVAKKMTLKI